VCLQQCSLAESLASLCFARFKQHWTGLHSFLKRWVAVLLFVRELREVPFVVMLYCIRTRRRGAIPCMRCCMQ
jgi:hypothetical protein